MPTARRYLVAVLVFLSAFALGVLGFAYHFHVLATPADLAQSQVRDSDNIILPADIRYNAAFKLARIGQARPDVICIGTSRPGTFRDWMFKPYRFYNASFTAWTTSQLLDVFERSTREVRPRVVILAIDYFLFTDTWDKANGTERTMIYEPLRYVLFKFRYLSHSLPSLAPFQDDHRQDGFRRDGSYAYPAGFIEVARKQFQSAEYFLKSTPGAAHMSERQMAPIVQLASLAQQRGIKLIAIQLPYIRSAVDYLDYEESYRPWSGVWREFESEQTAAWLRGLGITFFDMAHSSVGTDPLNFIDAYHPSDDGMVKLLDQLLNEKEFRAQFPDMNKIE
ncbi:hydrolase [Bradyrhizobium sp. SZCCHNPS2010]|uniref:hydrolase n=1 Tax=Bradyrhizobium sp. SZCCHNPS2010 TaxID=3057333 RepID=UPI002916269B|nr:hydrolase [Bradyrhizobium sp. SZCCHNPS2010]